MLYAKFGVQTLGPAGGKTARFLISHLKSSKQNLNNFPKVDLGKRTAVPKAIFKNASSDPGVRFQHHHMTFDDAQLLNEPNRNAFAVAQ